MKLVFYSVVLNHHQAPLADEFYKMLGHDYCFVELTEHGNTKGNNEDYSRRPYLVQAWESSEMRTYAMNLATTADCCVFSGVAALPYQKTRLKLGLLSFDMGERWLKHGIISFFSPRLLRWLFASYLGGWKNKPLYKLCMSAFAAGDHYKMGMFKNKAFKWAYFTSVDNERINSRLESLDKETKLMWCSRYLKWKHPELPILMAVALKQKGYNFHLDMFGSGDLEERVKNFVIERNLKDVVTIHGSVPNELIHKEMRDHEIFLFTSDRYEGWGAVANESLSEGCVLVASDSIGSSPYLIEDGVNGFMFTGSKDCCSINNPDTKALTSLVEKVCWLLEHSEERLQMQENAYKKMRNEWSPENAARSLLILIDSLSKGKDTPILHGPCSKA